MDLRELMHEGISSLFANPIRTGLAMLGVIIGIGSVIALVSLGQASQKSVTDRIASLGTNLITVRSTPPQGGGVRQAFGNQEIFTAADVTLLETQGTTIAAVSPEANTNAQIVVGRSNMNSRVVGVTNSYTKVNTVTLASGTFPTQRQMANIARVAVIGSGVAAELFPNQDPVGQDLSINGQVFRVIGTLASKGGNSFNNQDDMVFIPLTTLQKLFTGKSDFSSLSIAAKNQEVMTQAKAEVEALLLKNHPGANPSEAGFQTFSQEDLLGTATQITGTFTTLLSGIAAISLVVGGIGIMNIMLVTVTERTREIGLRKALGAKKRTIIQQFLFESIVITLCGGILGIGLGVGVSYAISALMGLAFTISSSAILLSTAVSIAIGLIFGWYPARLAANLAPIEALRYE